MAGRVRVRIGDVLEIPLPNGKFAYGRVYDDAGVGIYEEISDTPGNPPIGSRKFMFNVGIYEDVLTTGEWEIVGERSFLRRRIDFPASGVCQGYH